MFFIMAKITPSELIQNMSGKICAHSDTYFATNKQTGNVYAAKICNPSQEPATAKQTEVRAKFASRGLQVKAWFATNKPTESNPKGTELYIAAKAKFKSQHKIGSFAGYVAKYLQDDGTMGSAYTMGKITGTITGGTTNPPAGGGGGGSTEIEED